MCHLCRYLWLHLGTAQGSVLSLAVVIPDLVQGVVWSGWNQNIHQAGAGSEGVVAARTGVSVLLPEIRAASVAVFSQDLSAPDAVLSCRMGWTGSGCSGK